ncbi:hypothetical protein RI845_05675 [Thalassotalea nanhaiensis]|uniref:Uncharacterized protein n=1 Tax=Thalassotalea nanhaiensis TaxID=3065648 RepID=A0ABY9TLK5_9GAMM|nr:hypothetical protein RI845_05675 [Colwelliaceae bacterium SQ345]
MSFKKVQLNAPHLTLWLSEDNGLLFHEGKKELSQIEPISIALLMALDEGLTNEQALIELQQYSSLSKEQLKPSLAQVKALFKKTEEQHTYADGLYPELQSHLNQQPEPDSFCLKVANATFAITSDDEDLLNEIKELLAPVQIIAPNEVHFAIDIEIYKGNYLLVSNDIVVEEGLAQNQVMPVFIDRLQILAYQHSDYCFGFHGAALTNCHFRPELVSGSLEATSEAEVRHSRLVRETTSEAESRHSVLVTETINDFESKNMDPRMREEDDETVPSSSTTILLPGVSGAGKSTLTAELSTQNFAVYSDEIIALNDDFNLIGLSLPMAIKSGSWQHIANLYPELNTQPEWHRVDGRILKYIWPAHIAEHTESDIHQENGEPSSSLPELVSGSISTSHKTLLINPSYSKNASPKATKLSVTHTIALVTNGGYQLGVELTEERVEQLIRFCEQISAYQITYSSSEHAQQLVDQICEK